MSESKNIDRPMIVSKALQHLGALQAMAELLNIDDFEPGYLDRSGERSYSVSDIMSGLVIVFTMEEKSK